MTTPVRPAALDQPCVSRRIGRLEYIGGSTDNLGDHAMLDAARCLLPGVDLVRLAEGRLPRLLRRLGLARSSLVMIGGGTLINDVWLGLASSLHRGGSRLITLGTGVGSWGLGQAEQMDLSGWVELLRDCREIGVRGPLSARRLQKLGLTQAVVAGDPALFFAEPAMPVKAAEPAFALSAIDWDREPDLFRSGWPKALAEAAADLIRQGWRMKSIAMHPGDVIPLRALHQRMGLRHEPILQPGSCQELLDELRPCRFAVGLRLHLSVLAACVGAVPVMIGYRDKHLDFMESVNLAGWHFDVFRQSPGELTGMIRQAAGATPAEGEAVLRSALAMRSTLLAYAGRILGSA